MSFRIHLSPPHLDGEERALLLDALDSGWVAPAGPHLGAFETELAATCDRAHAVCLSSGTAALHLALLTLGIGPGDEVLVATLTFAATANAVRYVGATPVFVDADAQSWNLDVAVVADELARCARLGLRQPAAIIPVDLYGRCADYTALLPLAERYGIPVIADAAEALGATHAGRPAGTFGRAAVLSFNGNKIITTSGGGALLTDDAAMAAQVRKLANQAREPARHYEHHEVGYNYRMSNLLAAVGRGQLARLSSKVARRREINARYRHLLADLPGIAFPTPDTHGVETCWLTCLLIDPEQAGTDRDQIIDALARESIEARPVWKPMHLQPVYADAPMIGGEVAERLFRTGLCLPSGSGMEEADVDEVASRIRSATASR